MKSVYVKVQGGERFEAPNEEKAASILESLHPDYSAEATFSLGEDEWLSARGCSSDGFALAYQPPSATRVRYCPRMLSLAEARMLIGRFLRGEPDWQAGFSWRTSSRAVQIGVVLLWVAVTISILVSFVKALAGWF